MKNDGENLCLLDANSIKEIFINEKNTLNLKIEIFRKINKIIIYNEDLKISHINSSFFLDTLKDIYLQFDLNNKNEIENKNYPNEYEKNKDKLLYLKLYLLYLYNISNSDSNYTKKIFSDIFGKSEISKDFYKLIIYNISDLKIQKFVLGILYNIIFNQITYIKHDFCWDEFIGFFCIILKSIILSYDLVGKSNNLNLIENSQQETELKEINDWIYLIFTFIIKSKETFKFNYEILEKNYFNIDLIYFKPESIFSNNIEDIKNEMSILEILLNKQYVGDFVYLILEILRDCVENTKSVNSERYILISNHNFIKLKSILCENILNLMVTIKELIDSKNFEKINFYTFDKLKFEHKNKQNFDFNINLFQELKNFCYCDENEIRKILDFKEFICLVDIFSIFLTTDIYRNNLFDFKNDFDFIERLISLIKTTDFIYDDYFMRYKSLKNSEKIEYNYFKLNENNIFHSFQTNIFKILSNYSYRNDHFKEKLIDCPELLLDLLNHMKIDNCNPFKKEWTILMVKSLCESIILPYKC